MYIFSNFKKKSESPYISINSKIARIVCFDIWQKNISKRKKTSQSTLKVISLKMATLQFILTSLGVTMATRDVILFVENTYNTGLYQKLLYCQQYWDGMP